MCNLSVNINKFATLRNARGGNNPDVYQAAVDCLRFGAQGITVHPRPDARHIRYSDVRQVKGIPGIELNIEGNPDKKFIELVLEVKPAQVTLVPDAPDVITSDAGWDTHKHQAFLREVVGEFKSHGIRTSLFIDPVPDKIEAAATTGTDRVELYTEAYARGYNDDPQTAVANYISAAHTADLCNLGLNAGHDLDRHNLAYFYKRIPSLLEVSIGHALICDALYLGLENTIQIYLRQLHAGD